MFVVLALVFLVAPLVEIYVMVQVADAIGVPETILLLIFMSFLGAWLAKLAGLGVLSRLQRTLRAGRKPSNELVDGALVLFAGALMIAPGFLSDGLAALLLLPPTRAVIRGVVLGRLQARGGVFQVLTTVPGSPPGRPGEVWDVESWEDDGPDPSERPGLMP